MATVQLRTPTEGRAYYDRKKAASKTSMEAMRCVKRRLSDIVYRTMLGDYVTGKVTGPGGQRGNDSDSSATGSQPHTGTSDKPLPGPARPETTLAAAGPPEPFPGPFPPPCPRADSQPASSAICLTPARTGAPSTGGNEQALTQRGATTARSAADE